MRAYELTKPKKLIVEGGNAFPDVGIIHIDEIKPTMRDIAKLLGMPNAVNQALGSVGKAEYSGDIDIAVDLDRDKMKIMSKKLRDALGNQNVTGVAGNISFRFPISNYDETKQGRQPRTGLVQVDLIPGEPAWMKTFFHSAGDVSKFKGIHRNLAISAVAAQIDHQESKEQDDYGRSVEAVRWAWGPKGGLQKVRKTSIRNEKTGKWLKKQNTELLTEPIKTPDKIVEILFKGKVGSEALNSMESIIDAVKKTFSNKEMQSIFKKMADSLESRKLDKVGLPAEIQKYI